MTETDRGAEEAAVLNAADSLITAFGHHDVERYFAAFRPDASFVFHTHPERLDSVGAYRDLWRHWERDSGFRVIDLSVVEPAGRCVRHMRGVHP